jgi:hypothetical protein
VTKQKRPEGQKKAKAKLKGKGKTTALSPLGDQPTQNMVLYHETASIKIAAMMKAAEETSNVAVGTLKTGYPRVQASSQR